MKKLKLYFVRHGQTIFNKYNRMQGWSDSPLTEKGYADAHRAGARLKNIAFDAAYASDTTRAMNTANAIMAENAHEQLPIETMPEFREEFYGYYEGNDSAQAWFEALMPVSGKRTFHEFLEENPIAASKDAMKAADPFHDAENDAEFWDRLNRGFAQLMETHNDGDTILVVSHGTTIRSMAGKADPTLDITWGPQNGSINRFTLDEDGLHLDEYNNHGDEELL